jgi:hypothetical protein
VSAPRPAPRSMPEALRALGHRVRRLSHWRGTPETFAIEKDDICLALWRIARALERDPALAAGSGAAGAPRSFPGKERS